MQSMKGATMLLGSMNRQMNLPALQRIAIEFERENDVMDQRQDMMDDAIDEATGMEADEEEGEDIVKEVLDEIGVDLNQSVRIDFGSPLGYRVLTCFTQLGETPSDIQKATVSESRVAQPVGAGAAAGGGGVGGGGVGGGVGGGGGGGGTTSDDDLQARLDSLRR